MLIVEFRLLGLRALGFRVSGFTQVGHRFGACMLKWPQGTGAVSSVQLKMSTRSARVAGHC